MRNKIRTFFVFLGHPIVHVCFVLHLLPHVDPARVGVLVGHESGDCPEHDGDHEEGEKDAEAYSLATVRFLKRTEVALLKYLYLMKSTLS